ncbi:DUF960 family protein [Staphylococcus pseudintermedius]
MNRYITRGIANNLPNILQHQLWQLVSEREQEQTKDNTLVDYFSYIPVQYTSQSIIYQTQTRTTSVCENSKGKYQSTYQYQ